MQWVSSSYNLERISNSLQSQTNGWNVKEPYPWQSLYVWVCRWYICMSVHAFVVTVVPQSWRLSLWEIPPSRTQAPTGQLKRDTCIASRQVYPMNLTFCPQLLIHVNSYCWTLQASHSNRAFLKFLPDFSAILLASSGGRERPSFLQVCCSTAHI